MMNPSVVVLALAAAASTQASLAPCDSSKIAMAVVPTYDTPDAAACATATLNGRSFNSLFETTPATADTIKAVSANPSCKAWFADVAKVFTGFEACSFLGRNVQEYGKLTLTEFLEANNKEIQSFDPSRTEAPTTEAPAVTSATTVAPNNANEATTVPKTTTAAPVTTKASSAASIALTVAAAAVSASALFFA